MIQPTEINGEVRQLRDVLSTTDLSAEGERAVLDALKRLLCAADWYEFLYQTGAGEVELDAAYAEYRSEFSRAVEVVNTHSQDVELVAGVWAVTVRQWWYDLEWHARCGASALGSWLYRQWERRGWFGRLGWAPQERDATNGTRLEQRQIRGVVKHPR